MPSVLPLQQQQWPRGPLNEVHIAARDGSTERTLALISNGSIDIDQGDPRGFTPLMFASAFGYSRVVRILLGKGANVSIVADKRRTALNISAEQGHVAVTKMLVKAGGDIEAENCNGYTPLDLATKEGHSEVMRVLIEAGANLKSRGVDGENLLFCAARRGHVGAVRELLRAKVDPLLTVPNSSGGTMVPLEVAAHFGQSEVVRELLQQFGIEGCGGASGGCNALIMASRQQHVGTMAILTDAGVVDTGSILNAAARNGCEASVKFLVRQQEGKSSGRGVYLNNIRSCFGFDFGTTPLLSSILYCPSSSPRIVRLLVDAGADTTSDVGVINMPQGEFYFDGTPLAFTTLCLHDKKVRGKDATEEDLHTLEAIRRLLLRVEAVHAVSWLWPGDVPAITDTAEGSTRAKTASAASAAAPLRMMLPILRRRTERRGVLLSALFRHSSKP